MIIADMPYSGFLCFTRARIAPPANSYSAASNFDGRIATSRIADIT